MRNSWTNRCAILLLAFVALHAQNSNRTLSSKWEPAQPGYSYHFPQDYFNHPDYQTEWWYYTGNLKSSDGHRFGFELTFFRQGILRASSSEPWFVHDLWMAHMALSDIGGKRFYHQERLNRAGPELAGLALAGVDSSRSLVWNGNWQARITERGEQLQGVGDNFGFALHLALAKPPVIQGRNGISQKAEGSGHASHYFSLTRLITTGSIDLDGKTYTIDGTSWMDHEFFSDSMASNETGWDWLSVQLNDGTELMLYRLRHKDGSIDPYSSGSYVDAHGKATFLSIDDFAMTPSGDTWLSPATKAAYPLKWHISIPHMNIAFDVTTPLKTQELTNSVGPSYWEGAIGINGSRDNAPVRGVGYLEMTGYAQSGQPILPVQ